jgi:hypothetical protein
MVNPCVFRSCGETRSAMNGKPFWATKKSVLNWFTKILIFSLLPAFRNFMAGGTALDS